MRRTTYSAASSAPAIRSDAPRSSASVAERLSPRVPVGERVGVGRDGQNVRRGVGLRPSARVEFVGGIGEHRGERDEPAIRRSVNLAPTAGALCLPRS
ncbi:MAG: hypothetical protein U0531_22530 [Dehalococcoidia bacterium]